MDRGSAHMSPGFKGVVVIDRRLTGVKMRLRKSMNKFEALDKDVAPIESLACPHRIVKPFKVDYIKSVNQC